jgi:hypothetical protein
LYRQQERWDEPGSNGQPRAVDVDPSTPLLYIPEQPNVALLNGDLNPGRPDLSS